MGDVNNTADDYDVNDLMRTSASSFSQSGASPQDVVRLDNLITQVGNAVKGQAIVQQNLQALDNSNNADMIAAFMKGADLQTAAGVAAGNQAAAKTTGTIAESSADQAAANAIGTTQGGSRQDIYDDNGNIVNTVDTRSDLYKNIDAFKESQARASALLDAAEHQNGMSLVDVFRGTTSFSDWFNAKVINTPEDYESQAKLEMGKAAIAADTISKLQADYDGSARQNAQTFEGLKAGTAADAATVAAGQWNWQATQLKTQALIQNAANIQGNIQNSKSIQQVAISQGDFASRAINFERMAVAYGAKVQQNPQDFVAAVKLGAKASQLPGYENLTPSMLATILKNPAEAAKMQTLADVGIRMSASTAEPVGGVSPNIYSSPGAAWTLSQATGAPLLPGSEPVKKWIDTLAVGTDTFNGKTLKPAERSSYINQRVGNEWNNIKDNLAASDAFGKPSFEAVLAHAAFNTPEMAPIKSILTPLVNGNKPVPEQMIIDALYNPSANLTQAQRVAAITTYGRIAAQQIDDTRRPTAYGLPSVQRNGYTAMIGTSQGLLGHFRGIRKLNMSDTASAMDYDNARLRDMRAASITDPFNPDGLALGRGGFK